MAMQITRDLASVSYSGLQGESQTIHQSPQLRLCPRTRGGVGVGVRVCVCVGVPCPPPRDYIENHTFKKRMCKKYMIFTITPQQKILHPNKVKKLYKTFRKAGLENSNSVKNVQLGEYYSIVYYTIVEYIV